MASQNIFVESAKQFVVKDKQPTPGRVPTSTHKVDRRGLFTLGAVSLGALALSGCGGTPNPNAPQTIGSGIRIGSAPGEQPVNESVANYNNKLAEGRQIQNDLTQQQGQQGLEDQGIIDDSTRKTRTAAKIVETYAGTVGKVVGGAALLGGGLFEAYRLVDAEADKRKANAKIVEANAAEAAAEAAKARSTPVTDYNPETGIATITTFNEGKPGITIVAPIVQNEIVVINQADGTTSRIPAVDPKIQLATIQATAYILGKREDNKQPQIRVVDKDQQASPAQQSPAIINGEFKE